MTAKAEAHHPPPAYLPHDDDDVSGDEKTVSSSLRGLANLAGILDVDTVTVAAWRNCGSGEALPSFLRLNLRLTPATVRWST